MSTYTTAENAPPDFRRAQPVDADESLITPDPPIELNGSREQTLHAAVDRIIPADDFPGAWDAGVGDYILRQLNGDLRHLAHEFLAGLDLLDQEAIANSGSTFANLPGAVQDELLHQLEKNLVKIKWRSSPREFFAMLLHLTHEGFYADPGNGGNRDEVAWKMMGYEHRPLGNAP